MYKSRVNYWTCSKFADWLRVRFGLNTKPKAETIEGWDEWHRTNKTKNKVADWIVEEGLDHLQDIWMFFPDIYYNIRVYVRNRWVEKSHYLNTKLEKGKYHEIGDRIFHGLFETLVEFVEGEKAHMMWMSDRGFGDNEDKSVKKKNYKNSREHGLRYLDWEISLGEESPYQAKAAQEIKDLYLWYKDTYTNRTDSFELSGLDTFWEENKDDNGDKFSVFSSRNMSDEAKEKEKELFAIEREIEQKYIDEDTEMMIRLIKIRKSMWT